MKILLFGKNGQVGWELQRSLTPLGELLALNRHDYGGDLTRPQQVLKTILDIKPDVVVNAAAYTAVDKAESEPELARLINTEAVYYMAKACKDIDSWLVHYSTDYVFDGSGQLPWREHDDTYPINIYGQTKLAGEHAIIASHCKHVILRTSWVYATRGQNFVNTILYLFKEKSELNIIVDQIGAPTAAELIADVSSHILKSLIQRPELAGIYHLVASGYTNWFDYANLIWEHMAQANIKTKTINPIVTANYKTSANRPKNSRLANSKLQATFGLTLPHWQHGVIRMLTEVQ